MLKKTYLKILCLPLLAFCITTFAANDSGVKVKWGYEGDIGAEHWGQLNSAFALCSDGKTQSPINITSRVSASKNTLITHYKSDPMVIMEDGNTTLTIGKVQTVINEGHGLQLNFPTHHEREMISFAGADYQLIQFHLHTPSENTIQGRSYPLEIHFVHQGKNGAVAVIGVFVRSGKANPALEQIIRHLPKEKGVPENIVGHKINPAVLLPAQAKYYAFAGSLTTPPCSEGLQWIMLKNPITASPQQIAAIKAELHGFNARPVQPLNKRKVFYAE